MDNLNLTNYKLNRSLFSLIQNIDAQVCCYVEDKSSLNGLLNFYKKQKSKKKYYELSDKNRLLCLFNKFI